MGKKCNRRERRGKRREMQFNAERLNRTRGTAQDAKKEELNPVGDAVGKTYPLEIQSNIFLMGLLCVILTRPSSRLERYPAGGLIAFFLGASAVAFLILPRGLDFPNSAG
jgi:hypothetical protein